MQGFFDVERGPSRRRHPSRAEPAPVCVAVPLRACPARLPSEPACLLSDICDARSPPRIQGDIRCTQWRTRVHPTSVDNPTTGTRPQRASARISAHRLGPITSASIRRKTQSPRRLGQMIDPLNTRTASAPPEKTPDVEAADNGKRLVQRQASLNGSRPCVPSLSRAASLIIPLTYVIQPSVIDFPVTIYSQIYADVQHAHSSTTTHLDVCPQPRLCPTAAPDIPNGSLRPPHAARQPGTETTALACIKPLPVLQGNNDGANRRPWTMIPTTPAPSDFPGRTTSIRHSRYLSTGLCASLRAQPGDCILLPPVLQSDDEDADGLHRRAASEMRTPADHTSRPPRPRPRTWARSFCLTRTDALADVRTRQVYPPQTPHIARHPHRSGGDARVARSVPARSMLRPRVRILAFAPFAVWCVDGGLRLAAHAAVHAAIHRAIHRRGPADRAQPVWRLAETHRSQERRGGTRPPSQTIESSRRLGAQQNTSSRALQHVYSSERPSACPGSVPALCTMPPPPSSGLMCTPGPRPHEPRATVGGVADGARVRAQSPALGQDALPMPSRAPAAAAALLQMRLEV
ncbi:hypothetical protein POSPLADRAFT_1061883 [Postia placenta MAD-698-R-SB12]|uniref:Uncharacterized protein n=1 Tax=Postia placenta MAD-698-R-SB12 TaxID=670580 RepID=A0A1X6ML98_9APHY|nr:hypothetical protein POSPLADRAFT_1061883 [Postia placenta MAD-698-R-SB12]OSX57184.1 hypothetical protein POSPLADRAFT_1061883 [Postia placenta MAD-698-R-SB12]